jgi:hypothetical protein
MATGRKSFLPYTTVETIERSRRELNGVYIIDLYIIDRGTTRAVRPSLLISRTLPGRLRQSAKTYSVCSSLTPKPAAPAIQCRRA